jgi:hypothetical protein
MEQLVKLSKEPGFTGSISPGINVSKERQVVSTYIYISPSRLRNWV